MISSDEPAGMRAISQRLKLRLHDIQRTFPSKPQWTVSIVIVLLLLLPALLKWIFSAFLPAVVAWSSDKSTTQNASYGEGFPAVSLPANDPTLRFAFVVGSICLSAATLILIISFFVYLFSANETRSAKAGALVKQTLAFVITTGGGVWAYLGFSSQH